MDPIGLIKAVPTDVAKDIYSDSISNTLREASKVGVDFVKTVRLALFPLQFTGMLQDRLASYIERSISRVPPENLVAPVESLTMQIADRLRTQEEGSIVTEMYVNLLSKSMDRECVGEAHPAFVHVVGQLSPDEAVLIEQMSRSDPSLYTRPPKYSDLVMSATERARAIQLSQMTREQKEQCERISIQPEDLAQPALVYTYIEHLVSLGLVSYLNTPWSTDFKDAKMYECDFWFIRLNGFGQLFHRACLSGLGNVLGQNRT